MAANRVDRVVTRGIFSIDGEDFEVDNNIWIVGDDAACFVIDAAHEVGPIVEGVGDRQALMILCTHGHNDHINAAVELADVLHAPIALHPADRMLWDAIHPRRAPDLELEDGGAIEYDDLTLATLHTPGHSPGGISFHDAANAARVRRRHALQGRTRCDGSIVLRLPHHHRVDPHPSPHPPGRDRRAPGPR